MVIGILDEDFHEECPLMKITDEVQIEMGLMELAMLMLCAWKGQERTDDGMYPKNFIDLIKSE